ncbi:protein suppressor of hairy wing-like [Argopecten irradians]|uniref:protein suppressor of hairy wing-like n=1 Tax=Argopecten irradians TaxID=31199 RepID=UPI0037232373
MSKTFNCDVCEKKLTTKQGLRRHIETHLSWELSEFQCTTCKKRFQTNEKLKKHLGSRLHKKSDMSSGAATPVRDERETDFIDTLVDDVTSIQPVSPANDFTCGILPDPEAPEPPTYNLSQVKSNESVIEQSLKSIDAKIENLLQLHTAQNSQVLDQLAAMETRSRRYNRQLAEIIQGDLQKALTAIQGLKNRGAIPPQLLCSIWGLIQQTTAELQRVAPTELK